MKQNRKRKRQLGRYHDDLDVACLMRAFWPAGYYANRKALAERLAGGGSIGSVVDVRVLINPLDKV